MNTAPPSTDGRSFTAPHSISVDVAVVGSGPGGATVARALSARGLRVCVLEEGPAVTPAMLAEAG